MKGALVVSNPKAGAHLIARLFNQLGYDVQGQGGRQWREAERREKVHWLQRLGVMQELYNCDSYDWFARLLHLYQQGTEVGPAPWCEGECVITHELALDRVDGEFFRDWVKSGTPRIIFLHRDPRACIVSYVNFLVYGNYGTIPEQLAHAAILKGYMTMEERIVHALSDPTFPGFRQMRANAWMLHHPAVISVCFEELVGPGGGGTESGQRVNVLKILNHIDSKRDVAALVHPTEVADGLYCEMATTFFTGQVADWKSYWSEGHQEVFERVHGDLWEAYRE